MVLIYNSPDTIRNRIWYAIELCVPYIISMDSDMHFCYVNHNGNWYEMRNKNPAGKISDINWSNE